MVNIQAPHIQHNSAGGGARQSPLPKPGRDLRCGCCRRCGRYESLRGNCILGRCLRRGRLVCRLSEYWEDAQQQPNSHRYESAHLSPPEILCCKIMMRLHASQILWFHCMVSSTSSVSSDPSCSDSSCSRECRRFGSRGGGSVTSEEGALSPRRIILRRRDSHSARSSADL